VCDRSASVPKCRQYYWWAFFLLLVRAGSAVTLVVKKLQTFKMWQMTCKHLMIATRLLRSVLIGLHLSQSADNIIGGHVFDCLCERVDRSVVTLVVKKLKTFKIWQITCKHLMIATRLLRSVFEKESTE
jgi:hypothetical protein